MDRHNCFHCGGLLVWNNDFSFEDMGYEGEGIVHILSCPDCGSEVEYRVPQERDEEE